MNFSWDVGVWKNSYFSQSIDWLWEGEDLQQQAPLETLGTSSPCLWMQLLWIGLCIFSVKEVCPFFFSLSLYRLALPGVCLTCYNLYIAIKSWNVCDVSQWPLQGIQIAIPISALKQGTQLTILQATLRKATKKSPLSIFLFPSWRRDGSWEFSPDSHTWW